MNFIWFGGLNFGDCSFWWKIVPRCNFLVCLNWKFLIKKVILGEINLKCVRPCVCIEGITLRKKISLKYKF